MHSNDGLDAAATLVPRALEKLHHDVTAATSMLPHGPGADRRRGWRGWSLMIREDGIRETLKTDISREFSVALLAMPPFGFTRLGSPRLTPNLRPYLSGAAEKSH